MSTPLPERLLTISPSLAATIGLEAALLYQLLTEWRHFLEGRALQGQRWYLLDKQLLEEQLPFWQWQETEQTLQTLHEQGLIVLGSTLNSRSANIRFALPAETPLAAPTIEPQRPKRESGAHSPPSSSYSSPVPGQQQLPANWRPDPAALEYLSRFNQISDSFIEQILPEFIAHHRESGETKSAWSSAFSQYAVRRWKQQQYKDIEQAKKQPINRHWRPSPDAWEILQRDGITQNFIEDAIPEFILYWSELGTANSNWNSRFVQHIRLQWARFRNAISNDQEYSRIPTDWQPSPEVFDILKMACIDAEFARAQVHEFVLYWRDSGQAHRSWNTKFLQHVKYRWANNHHLGQTDARQQRTAGSGQQATGFIEKHTDRSWADGL
jgi:hypothetical protein